MKKLMRKLFVRDSYSYWESEGKRRAELRAADCVSEVPASREPMALAPEAQKEIETSYFSAEKAAENKKKQEGSLYESVSLFHPRCV